MIVPGAGGDGPWYGALRAELAGDDAAAHTFRWGAPLPLFMLNLQDRGIHASAEKKLARRLADWRRQNPAGRLALVAHSAGCGVVLGALAQLDEGMQVDRVVLLAPSVSPGYDLSPALDHIGEELHIFHSDRDRTWLHWRTSTFGTYDNIKTPAAGHGGFTSIDQLDPDRRRNVFQHAYDPAWADLGNDGDHAGALSRPFVHDVLKELVRPTRRSGGPESPTTASWN